MLKLMKYEFIHSMRTFAVAFAVFLIACFVFPLTMHMTELYNIPFVFGFLAIGSSFLVLGISIALYVSIFINFYKSMFQKSGYLTLTLPVSTKEIIFSKFLTHIIWLFVGTLILFLGVLIAIFEIGIIEDGMSLVELIDVLKQGIHVFFACFQNEPLESLREICSGIFIIGSALAFGISMCYFSLTLTHTKWIRKHRLLLGIVLYFILCFVIQYFVGSLFHINDIIQSLSLCLFSIGFLFGTVYLIDHHIEIE